MKKPMPGKLHYYQLNFILLLAILITPATLANTTDVALSSADARTPASAIIVQEPKPDDVMQITAGVPIEREIAGDNRHSYQVRLSSKQYLKVIVKQIGIDAVVRVFGPAGQKLTEVDNTGGPETVFVMIKRRRPGPTK